MSNSYHITKVRTERPLGAVHEHIAMVELSNNPATRISRSVVVADLLSPHGNRYYTYAGGAFAIVIVARCPDCALGDYITTGPDWTELNTLLSLPRF